jgi:hypothetical protein
MLLKRFDPPQLLLSARRRAVARKTADAASISAAVSAISGAQGVRKVSGCLQYTYYSVLNVTDNKDILYLTGVEKWDPALDPEDQIKGASSGNKFVKLARFGLFVKVVPFIVPISSAIVESLFSRCATCPSHSSRLIIEVLMRSAQVRLHPWQDAREHGGRHRGQRRVDVGAGGRHRRRLPLLQPGLHAAGLGRGP